MRGAVLIGSIRVALWHSKNEGWDRVIPRDERLSARIGIAAGLLVFATTIGAAGWGLYTAKMGQHRAAVERATSTAMMLAPVIEHHLGEGELTQLKVYLSEVSAQQRLDICRLVLSNGSVVVDLVDGRPVVAGLAKSLPEKWEDAPSAEAGIEFAMGERREIEVPGRGRAFLYVRSDTRVTGLTWDQTAGIGVISAGSFAGLWLCYRWIRGRLRTVTAVRDALRLAHEGQTASSALAIAPNLGPEVQAWNAILQERDELRKVSMARRAGEQMSTRSSVSGDLAAACDALWQGLLLVNAKGEIVYANGAAATFLGTAREKAMSAEFGSLVESEEVRQAVRDAAAGKLRTRATIEVKSEANESNEPLKIAPEDRRSDKPAKRTGVLRFSVRPVRREDQAAVIILIEDVTQQRVADEARNAFVAHATHELRTPLTNIRLYTEQMIDEGETDAKVREKCLNVISQESRRLERIIGDMLSVSEIEAGALKLRTGDVRFETLFKELEDDFRPQAQAKEIALKFDLPPKLPVIRGDRDKIVLAIYNLVANAIKYTPAGGQVFVRMVESSDGVSIDVQDNGIGIKPEECEKVFERFYRSTDKRITNVEGTGLGLTLAREVVRLHGGDITVDSRIDKGSTFQIRIPTKAAA